MTDERFERLLGPVGEELSCEQCFEMLDEYVEVELAADSRAADRRVPGMHEHLEGCPACREEHESLRALVSREG
jgi:anti-sigma factor RsiW